MISTKKKNKEKSLIESPIGTLRLGQHDAKLPNNEHVHSCTYNSCASVCFLMLCLISASSKIYGWPLSQTRIYGGSTMKGPKKKIKGNGKLA